MKRWLPAVAAWLLAANLSAAPTAWTMTPTGSSLAFTATFENAPAPGVFHTFDASVRLDPDDPAASRVDVTIAIASADMGSDDVNEAIRGADWFDAVRFPVAEFHASEVRPSGPTRFVATGSLTVKGVSRPVSVPFVWKQSGDAATMTGEVSVDRATFGIGAGEWRSTKQVAGTVRIGFTVQLRRRG